MRIFSRTAWLSIVLAMLVLTACADDAPAGITTATEPGVAMPSAGAASGTPSDGTGSGQATPAATTPPVGAAEPVASTASMPDSALPRVRFSPANGGSVALGIEVPPEGEYSIGLSGRRSLGDRGMLFYFPGGSNTGFWMKNTHIDLDIAFVDASMRIIAIRTMRAESEEIHDPGAPYVAAVEAPAGWYARQGVASGAQVTWEFDLHAVTGR